MSMWGTAWRREQDRRQQPEQAIGEQITAHHRQQQGKPEQQGDGAEHRIVPPSHACRDDRRQQRADDRQSDQAVFGRRLHDQVVGVGQIPQPRNLRNVGLIAAGTDAKDRRVAKQVPGRVEGGQPDLDRGVRQGIGADERGEARAGELRERRGDEGCLGQHQQRGDQDEQTRGGDWRPMPSQHTHDDRQRRHDDRTAGAGREGRQAGTDHRQHEQRPQGGAHGPEERQPNQRREQRERRTERRIEAEHGQAVVATKTADLPQAAQGSEAAHGEQHPQQLLNRLAVTGQAQSRQRWQRHERDELDGCLTRQIAVISDERSNDDQQGKRDKHQQRPPRGIRGRMADERGHRRKCAKQGTGSGQRCGRIEGQDGFEDRAGQVEADEQARRQADRRPWHGPGWRQGRCGMHDHMIAGRH